MFYNLGTILLFLHEPGNFLVSENKDKLKDVPTASCLTSVLIREKRRKICNRIVVGRTSVILSSL